MNEREILAIAPGHSAEVARLGEVMRSAKSAKTAQSISPGEMPFRMVAAGNVGLVKIRGVMWRGLPKHAAEYGYHGTEWTIAGLERLMEMPEIDTVILDLHSPGGLVTGTAELAGKIREVAESGRRVIAWVDWMGASAAYWVAAAADAIYMLPSGQVGSVGAVIAWYDYTRYLDERGIELRAFTSDAPGKLRGADGREWTDEDEAYMQARVDRAGARFRAWVTERRPGVTPEAFSGDTWDGEEALWLGLVDGVAESLEEVLFREAGVRRG